MPGAYSADIRGRVIARVESGYRDAARVSQVTIASLRTICMEFPRLGKLFHNAASAKRAPLPR